MLRLPRMVVVSTLSLAVSAGVGLWAGSYALARHGGSSSITQQNQEVAGPSGVSQPGLGRPTNLLPIVVSPTNGNVGTTYQQINDLPNHGQSDNSISTLPPPPNSDAAAKPADSGAVTGAPTGPAGDDVTDTTTIPGSTTAAGAGNINITPPADDDLPPAIPDMAGSKATGLDSSVDNFWFYGRVARYDLSAAAGQQILDSNPDPRQLLTALETVATRRGDLIDAWLLRWRTLDTSSGDANIPKMRQVATKITGLINEGYAARAADVDWVRDTIYQMSTSDRAYDNNLSRIDRAGEMAAKVCVDILRNANAAAYHDTARRVLRDLKGKAVNPLLAATEIRQPQDEGTLIDVVSALGDLGYAEAIPYLARVVHATDVSDGVRSAAAQSLARLGESNSAATPAQLFYGLSEDFYYGQVNLRPTSDRHAYVWFWNDAQGLTATQVPTSIFYDVMAMRAAEYSLKLDPTDGNTVALWIVANTKREVDLPKGETDPTHQTDRTAHDYDTAAGVQFLDSALSRAMRDGNSPVAYRLTQCLRHIVGAGNMAGAAGEPIIQALYFQNRLVRFEAAFALAEAEPAKPFTGSERVVPILVEALSQTARPNVLVVAPSASGMETSLREAVRGAGCNAVSAPTVLAGINAAEALPTVDVIVISTDSDVQAAVNAQQTMVKFLGASILVLTKSPANDWATKSAVDPSITAMVMPTGDLTAGMKAGIQAARQRSGTELLTEQDAAKYALTAADLLTKLAISHQTTFNLGVAQEGLIGALNDFRPEIAEAAGSVLATLGTPAAQHGLADKALDDTTPMLVRVSLMKSLTINIKQFGNQLDPSQVAALDNIVSTAKNPELRSAASEARGALNLPADQTRDMILQQSKV